MKLHLNKQKQAGGGAIEYAVLVLPVGLGAHVFGDAMATELRAIQASIEAADA